MMDETQDVCLFSRKRLELTGIQEVESFTQEQITLFSSLGMIAIEGKELKIEQFSTERGEMHITGSIDSLYYYEARKEKEKGRWSSLFR